MTADRFDPGESAMSGGLESRRMTALRFVGGVLSLLASALLLRMAAMRLIKGVVTLFAAAAALVWGLTLVGGGGWVTARRWRRHSDTSTTIPGSVVAN